MLKGMRGGMSPSAPVGPLDFTDLSATPGNGTANTPRGRFKNAAAQSVTTITNSLVTVNSTVILTPGSTDPTALYVTRVQTFAGSFQVTVNAAATGNGPQFDFVVFN